MLQGPLNEIGWPPTNRAGMRSEAQAEDPEAIAQAHASAVTGACLAMGIRFAGTSSPNAKKTLLHYVDSFLKEKMAAPDPFSGRSPPLETLYCFTLRVCMCHVFGLISSSHECINKQESPGLPWKRVADNSRVSTNANWEKYQWSLCRGSCGLGAAGQAGSGELHGCDRACPLACHGWHRGSGYPPPAPR
jgi:hypothetical protein